MIIFQTNPFWTSILAYFINKERIAPFEYIAMVLCFCGVMSIALSKPATLEASDSSTRLQGIAVAFTLSWFFASCNVLNRVLKNVHYTVVLFYHALIGIALAVMVILGEHWIMGNDFRIYTWRQNAIILMCCTFDFIALNC
jgi:drug/metabolite transporter (DMT)-like permease